MSSSADEVNHHEKEWTKTLKFVSKLLALERQLFTPFLLVAIDCCVVEAFFRLVGRNGALDGLDAEDDTFPYGCCLAR